MTKQELLNEIERLKGELNRTNKKAEKEEAAQEIFDYFQALKDAGFSDERAWELLMAFVQKNI